MRRAFLIVATVLSLTACSGGSDGHTVTPVAVNGIVVGSYFRNARVCIDVNGNGVCDAGEPFVLTDSGGHYALAGPVGPVVAEIGTDASQYNPDTGASVPVTGRIVLRAPREAPAVVGVASTAVLAEMESNALSFDDALIKVASALGVSKDKLLGDFNQEVDASAKGILKSASAEGLARIQLALANAKPTDDIRRILASATGTLDKVRNLVVIYLENRSFDHLYGLFPGANGIANALASPSRYQQLDRDKLTALPTLPPVWSAGTDPAWSFVSGLPNQPFLIDAAPGGVPGKDARVATPDLVHTFYQNQMQINAGKNNMFAAWSDAGGLAMGYYDGASMKLWALARQFTLADNYFQGAFGGSFLNHFWLVCACSPIWPNPPAGNIPVLDASGTGLALAATSPASALSGWPVYQSGGSVTPKLADGYHYAVNTTQPPFQPSRVPPPAGGDPRIADPANPSVLPVQSLRTIGDALTSRNVRWRWYAGGWTQALAATTVSYGNAPFSLQTHHQPFNYFERFNPGTPGGALERAEHLRDYTDLLDDIQSGKLPPVAFYKPELIFNQHPGIGSFDQADAHVADLVARLRASPQWNNMLVIVTYDENGGLWDHVAPPKSDLWGPGTRVPAIIMSPFSKKGYVDSVPYDTTSIIKLLTRRFSLDPLPGVRSNVSDLSNSLDLMP